MKVFKSAFRRIRVMVLFALEECGKPYFNGVPAQMAFYLFMSVMPTIILFSNFLGVFSLSLDEILGWARLNISEEGLVMIEDIVGGTTSGLSNVLLAITALWGASKSQYSFRTISHKIDTNGEYAGDGFLRERAKSIIVTVALLVTFASALVILIYAPSILRLLIGRTRAMKYASNIWMHLRWLVVFTLYFFVILLIFFSAGVRENRFRDVLPGTIFTSLGFLAASYLFRLYVGSSASRDIIYGTLSNMVVMLVWFWLMSWILLLGVVFNKAWDLTD